VSVEWIRSSKCDNSSGNCVEAAFLPGGVVALRDSKHPHPVQTYDRDEWDTFIAGVKAGDFDR
jgi:predicted secreted Zn-dependent protease